MHPYRMSVLVVSFALAALAVVHTQSSVGHIRGIVIDSTGAVLPGVTVSIAPAPLGKRESITNERGAYAFFGIDPGPYTLTASLAGFQSSTLSAEVKAGDTVRLDFTLGVSSVAETITVTASSPSVNTQSAASRQVAGRRTRRPQAPFNTEAYDRITDNKWTEVARTPLSTFSTDVDTASYSNVRRFLNGGHLPPKDAVRIEELINYFSYGYSEPRDAAPIAVTTAIGDCPWDTAHKLALIGLQARRIDASRTPPRNLVFLIDVSGSMDEPDKLPLVKASLALLARNLTAKDRVAIVVYAGNTGLVLPTTPGDDASTILEAIQGLEAGGSTNGGAGIQLAYRIAQEQFIADGVNRVILATDGDFNVGVTDQGSLLRLIEEKRESGVALTVLGFGMGNLKDSTMEKLADAGNGNYAYVDTLAEARKVLVEQAGGTLVTVAKDVKLQVEFNPRVVSAYRLIGYENRLLNAEDFNDDRKDAGDMGAGHSVTALYELVPAGLPAGTPTIDPLKYQQSNAASAAARRSEAMTVKIRYKQPRGIRSSLIEVPVAEKAAGSADLGFAAAVAEFGMLLRDSEFRGDASFAQTLELARRFKGDDAHGHRAEFIRLIETAEGLRSGGESSAPISSARRRSR